MDLLSFWGLVLSLFPLSPPQQQYSPKGVESESKFLTFFSYTSSSHGITLKKRGVTKCVIKVFLHKLEKDKVVSFMKNNSSKWNPFAAA